MGRYATRSLRGRLVSVATSLLIGGLALVGPLLAPSMADAGDGGVVRRTGVDGRADCQEERNTQVALAALQVVFSEHRIDQIDQFFAEDFVQHSPYVPPGGREELKQWWASVVHAIPDVTTTVTQTVTKCSDVVTFRTVQGTIAHDAPELGIIGEGEHVQFRAADIFRVRNGKIIAHWEVADTGPLVTLALSS